MKIAICDDNELDIKNLTINLNALSFIDHKKIFYFTSATELLGSLEKCVYDIIFLDIEMPDINGIDLGKRIKDHDENTNIVFVTSFPQYAIDAFDCQAYHYLIKPANEKKIHKIVTNIYKKSINKNKYIIVKIRTESKKIYIKDIYYIEYCRRHVIYHLKEREYETVGKFSSVYDELKEYGFYQVHQGYIVNMEKIVDIDRFSIILQDNKSVMMSTRKRTDVILEYGRYLERGK